MAGLGGGFLIVPVLRLFFGVSPAFATADSLLFVFANTLAASIAFIRRRLVDVRSGLIISIAAIPSSFAGAYVVRQLSGRNFDVIYGIFLIGVAAMILVRRNRRPEPREVSARAQVLLEIATGVFVGFMSTLFGIGGGIVLVPILLIFFRLPAHTVVATSAFVVMLTSPVGVAAHGAYGDVDPWLAVPLMLGGFVGGSVGARLAQRMHSTHLEILMVALLFLAALALVAKHLL